MYKSRFHEGVCDLCGEGSQVITLGFPDTEERDKSYCIKCSGKFQYKINHYVKKVGDYFKTHICVSDLLFYYNIDDLLKCLASYAVTEEYFVVMVNKYLDEKCYSLNLTFYHDVYLRLSRINHDNYFIMNPSLYYKYQKVRKEIKEYSKVSCSRRISIIEYKSLLDTLNKLYPEV